MQPGASRLPELSTILRSFLGLPSRVGFPAGQMKKQIFETDRGYFQLQRSVGVEDLLQRLHVIGGSIYVQSHHLFGAFAMTDSRQAGERRKIGLRRDSLELDDLREVDLV